MQTLSEIYAKYAIHGPDCGHGDKGTLHSYIDEYETLLAPYRAKCSFLEIGLAQGLSVAMWDEYFGPECDLQAVDVSIVFDISPFKRWRIHKADATKPFLPPDFRFDVVIDDGSHMTQDQVATRNWLLPRMNLGGIYIIEDILNLEASRPLWHGAEIRDMRQKKGRFDDVLVIYRI